MSPGVTPGPGSSVGVILSYPRPAEWNVSLRERRPCIRSPRRCTTRLSPPPQKLANSATFRPISVVSWIGSVIDTVLRIAKFVFAVLRVLRASPFTSRNPSRASTRTRPPGLVQKVRVRSPWVGVSRQVLLRVELEKDWGGKDRLSCRFFRQGATCQFQNFL